MRRDPAAEAACRVQACCREALQQVECRVRSQGEDARRHFEEFQELRAVKPTKGLLLQDSVSRYFCFFFFKVLPMLIRGRYQKVSQESREPANSNDLCSVPLHEGRGGGERDVGQSLVLKARSQGDYLMKSQAPSALQVKI